MLTGGDFAGLAEAAPIEVEERYLPGERLAPWVDGFVTTEGIHIPLFVPQEPQG